MPSKKASVVRKSGVRTTTRHGGLKIAAETLLRRIAGKDSAAAAITIQPELVIRGTTNPAPAR